jgi:hypothetical protein
MVDLDVPLSLFLPPPSLGLPRPRCRVNTKNSAPRAYYMKLYPNPVATSLVVGFLCSLVASQDLQIFRMPPKAFELQVFLPSSTLPSKYSTSYLKTFKPKCSSTPISSLSKPASPSGCHFT